MPIVKETLSDELEFRGYWWIPGATDQKLSGTLKYSPADGALLSLLGSFSPINELLSTSTPNIDLIHGVSERGHNFTLLENRCGIPRISFPGITTEEVYPSWVFIGGHFNRDELIFSKCSFRLTHIEEWIGDFPFSHSYERGSSLLPFQATVKPQAALKYRLPKIDASLESGVSFQANPQRTRHFNLECLSWLSLDTNTKQSVEWYIKQITKFQKLGSLCLGLPIHVEKVVFKIKKSTEDTEKFEKLHVDLFYAQAPNIDVPQIATFHHIFTLRELGDDGEKIVNKWLDSYEKIEPALNLFFTVFFDRSMYIDVRFLLLAQAVEVLHRLLFSGSYVDEGKYQEILTPIKVAIPDSAGPKLRSRLIDLLSFGNQFSLRKRIKDLTNRFDSLSKNKIIDINSALINKIVDSRNYYTHYDPSLESKAARGIELYDLNQQIILILTVIIFEILGANIDDVKKQLQNHPQFRSYVYSG